MLPDPRLYFADLTDPRRETKNKPHKLTDIIIIVFCAMLSGIEDWVGMETFAEEKESWFRQFLGLPNGIPSHDTLSDVIGRLQPGVFAEAFLNWMQSALPSLVGEQICLDGKTLRGSRMNGKAVHLLSAYAAQARLTGFDADAGGQQVQRNHRYPGATKLSGINRRSGNDRCHRLPENHRKTDHSGESRLCAGTER